MMKEAFSKIAKGANLDKSDLMKLLSLEAPDSLQQLYDTANRIRKEQVGEEVHLRGLIEFSNYCRRNCFYCGLRRTNCLLSRYRMDLDEILDTVALAEALGYHTVVLQSGEDGYYTLERLTWLVKQIKQRHKVAITLSVGELPRHYYEELYDVGADRYLIRFETSNPDLYARLHPDSRFQHRMTILQWLKEIGYEVGSGIMIGLPGQTLEDLAGDILAFKDLDLDMIGVGPYISHPETPLGGERNGSVDMTLKVIALTRIVTKNTNIPATTALATLRPDDGREMALEAGANVLMPNVTPVKYRAMYELYPDKVCIEEGSNQCWNCTQRRIQSIGRQVGRGAGMSLNKLNRNNVY
ncbi:MAG TPA: [FeFe] hydrogenase H-cluster radical SAM maturase HydE [Syntrophomonadaceae bacterium]|nr:[FeFe] hydrogenase H-cluster radical SAM maturase HydE [Syntrophomonadaceae bacterium]